MAIRIIGFLLSDGMVGITGAARVVEPAQLRDAIADYAVEQEIAIEDVCVNPLLPTVNRDHEPRDWQTCTDIALDSSKPAVERLYALNWIEQQVGEPFTTIDKLDEVVEQMRADLNS